MSVNKLASILSSTLVIVFLMALHTIAQPLTLTSAGVSAGFTLTTLATGYPAGSGNVGPIGIAFTDVNHILVTEPRFNAVNILSSDTDNQIAGSNVPIGYTEYGLAKIGDTIYAATSVGVIQINPDGSFNQAIVSGFLGVGIVTNPANGHLLVSDDTTTIYDVDPVSKTKSVFKSGLGSPDGLTISADGSTLYEADFGSGNVYAFNTNTKTQTLIASGLSSADGISIGYGSIANKLFVNCGTGNLYQIDLSNNNTVTLIASGGSRGDFVVPDPNGTLLLTQSDRILRLTAPPPSGSFVKDGEYPEAPLVQGQDGNFYGTTSHGGAFVSGYNSLGTAFKLDSSGKVTILHSFNGADGFDPSGGLARGSDGNFYGVSGGGGISNNGTIYKITPGGNFTILYRFTGQPTDGSNPRGELVLGSDGNFYGVTSQGGANNNGTIFKMNLAGNVTILHSFSTSESIHPVSTLIQGRDGYLYGTTTGNLNVDAYGGYDDGSVFKADLAGNVTILHLFNGLDGANPSSALIQANDGNFYGTTYIGGAYGSYGATNPGGGTIFQITSTGSFTVLHSFNGTDGGKLNSLIQANDGYLYGTASTGGTSGQGVVFRTDTIGNVIVLHSFDFNTEGGSPHAGLVQGSDSYLYGTTYYGGTSQYATGTAFKIDVSGNLSVLHAFN